MNSFHAIAEPCAPEPFPKERAQEGEMTEAEARQLTDEIKADANGLAEKLHRAHEGRAWKALGYDSWKAYCGAEFRLTKQRSYQLLAFVEIRNRLVKSLPGLTPPVNEKQTRPLAGLGPDQQTAVWKCAIGQAGGEQPTTKQVASAVSQAQAPSEPVFVEDFILDEIASRRPPLPMFDTVVHKLAAEIRGFIDVTNETKRARKIQEILAVQGEMSPASQEKLQCLKTSLEYLSRRCAELAKAIHPPRPERRLT